MRLGLWMLVKGLETRPVKAAATPTAAEFSALAKALNITDPVSVLRGKLCLCSDCVFQPPADLAHKTA